VIYAKDFPQAWNSKPQKQKIQGKPCSGFFQNRRKMNWS